MTKYRVVRFYFDAGVSRRAIKTNISLKEAKAWCRDPETSSKTATGSAAIRRTRLFGQWFDAFEEI
jgi:hypothetical protein